MNNLIGDQDPPERLIRDDHYQSDSQKAKMNREAYFQSLRDWVNLSNLHSAMTRFPYYLMSNYPQFVNTQVNYHSFGGTPVPISSNQPLGATQQWNQQNINNVPQPAQPQAAQNNQALHRLINMFNRNPIRREHILDNHQRNVEVINLNGGYEYVISPLWKRFVAETIDVCILFVLKLFIAFMIIDIFELDFGFDFDALRTSIEEDYTDFITFSSEMIYIEIMTKIWVCFYEALWTRSGQFAVAGERMVVGGATPGKICMGIRILYVEAIIPLEPIENNAMDPINQPPLRALVFPAQNPGFKRAFCRAVAKNILMTLLFPLCFVVLFYRNNRTSYDIMTKTIVVEANPNPILRQR